MDKKLYYDDPLAAAYMAREFGVEFLQDELVDEVSCASPKLFTSASHFDDKFHFHINDKKGRKYYIHPDSYHIFEPQGNDVGFDTCDNETYLCNVGIEMNWPGYENAVLTCNDGGDFWKIHDNFKIIQRNNKPFFMPKEEVA